jgi:protein-S-isoprenylcysteine O-methyltransferase Ste14
MKNILMFVYSVISYLLGFVSLLFWILSTSNLIPAISIDRNREIYFPSALFINIGLVLLFGIQHSVMARKPFKEWLGRVLPKPVERSTYVLISGILLAFLVWNWQPMGGLIWSIDNGSVLFYAMYVLFILGWSILFISTFIINHFDMFGLRQTYFELIKKPYSPLVFRANFFYKYIRHPLYFGGILGLWATPVMTFTHLCFATLLTAYFVIGSIFEEKDLVRDFGDQYRRYQENTGKFMPFRKAKKSVHQPGHSI